MADSIADINIPTGVWTDVMAASGIAVGTAVSVYNKGNQPCLLANKATAPLSVYGAPLYAGGNPGSNLTVIAGTTGLWCYVINKGGTVLAVQA
jgi:hypothetical protein